MIMRARNRVKKNESAHIELQKNVRKRNACERFFAAILKVS